MNNLNTTALDEMSDAAAHAALTLAKSKTGFFEDGSRRAARDQKDARKFDAHGHERR